MLCPLAKTGLDDTSRSDDEIWGWVCAASFERGCGSCITRLLLPVIEKAAFRVFFALTLALYFSNCNRKVLQSSSAVRLRRRRHHRFSTKLYYNYTKLQRGVQGLHLHQPLEDVFNKLNHKPCRVGPCCTHLCSRHSINLKIRRLTVYISIHNVFTASNATHARRRAT
jgi:hypothetical protein